MWSIIRAIPASTIDTVTGIYRILQGRHIRHGSGNADLPGIYESFRTCRIFYLKPNTAGTKSVSTSDDTARTYPTFAVNLSFVIRNAAVLADSVIAGWTHAYVSALFLDVCRDSSLRDLTNQVEYIPLWPHIGDYDPRARQPSIPRENSTASRDDTADIDAADPFTD